MKFLIYGKERGQYLFKEWISNLIWTIVYRGFYILRGCSSLVADYQPMGIWEAVSSHSRVDYKDPEKLKEKKYPPY